MPDEVFSVLPQPQRAALDVALLRNSPARTHERRAVGAGFLSYTVIAVVRGKAREVHPLMYLVSAIFAWYFIHGVVG